jgi:hypothetical protein
MNGKRRAIAAQQIQVQGQTVIPGLRGDEVVLPDIPIGQGDERREAVADQLRALDPEQAGGGEIGRFDQPTRLRVR